MESNTITIFYLFILIIMSAFFSATETAFSALNKIRIKNLATNGNKKAQLVLDLSSDYDKLLSTILIGNNIVNISSASLATVLFVRLFGESGVTISTIVMTILLLIFSEISPKTLAKENAESFAMFSVKILKFLIFILAPINYFFGLWKILLSKIYKKRSTSTITEEELITIVEEAKISGGIDSEERDLIRSAIEFNDVNASDILTPRIDVVAISELETKQNINKIFLETGYTRIPVYKNTIDNIIGVINQKDFNNYVANTDKNISSILKEAVYVYGSIKISKLLKLLQKSKSHIAIIIEDHGGTLGIVTLEDIIEELVGEIWDEHDDVINTFEKISETEYKVFCSESLDKFFNFFKINQHVNTRTISGWIVYNLGKIPNKGDSFKFENLTITVTKVDHRRVLEILVLIN